MEGISAIISSIATILWPLIVIVIVFAFRRSVEALIISARGRKFAVKIGEMELSMDEFSKQQGDMIKDLQTRVNELQRQIDPKSVETESNIPTTENTTFEEKRVEIRRAEDLPKAASKPGAKNIPLDIDDDISDILWVDDHPKNNAFIIDSLKESEVKVSTALSTEDALKHFKLGTFDCVISDTCRQEGKETPNCHAGFELSSLIRELDEDVPIYIYTDKVDEKMKAKAHTVGATAITSSPSELLKLLSD